MKAEQEKRHYKIPHNFYDEFGNIIEVRDIDFTTNMTDTTVYITMEALCDCHSQMPHGKHSGSAKFNPADFGDRKIVLEHDLVEGLPEIDGYEYECNGSTAQYIFHRKGDKENKQRIFVVDVVWGHPWKKK